ncbi:unnamed protein product [Orchesella dallaii]|uniref:C2H2-type domain-containing protein n=1 Tax=Orchesella dallaii TaxID=48710 RepID=A0ABP1RPY0_9HEXA
MESDCKSPKKSDRVPSNIIEKTKCCTVCEYRTNNMCSLRDHMRTHTNERPFKCSICKSSYRTKSQLQKHVRYFHGPEKRPRKKKPCVFCLKLFDSSDMFVHIKSHIKEKAFSCSILWKGIYQRQRC